MKKIISFFLAVCIMATMAVTVSAEETSYYYGTLGSAKPNSMEWILTTDGDTQTFIENCGNYQISNDRTAGARWLLFKINVGTGWTFSETTAASFKLHFYIVYTGDTTAYVLPSSKEEWAKAYNALDNGLTGENKLEVPVLTGDEPSGTYTASKTSYNKKCSVSLSADVLNSCYNTEDGCLYMTVAVTTTASTLPGLPQIANYVTDGMYHSLTLYGTQVFSDPNLSFEDADSTIEISNKSAVVTTNAGTGTAKVIGASYIGNRMTDVVIYDVNAADAVKGKISVDISSIFSGAKETKAFLWKNDLITPLTNVAEIAFKLKQETFRGANNTSSSCSTFYSMSEPAFIIPGLNQCMVPQGIEYREDTNQFYLSGYYSDGSASVICVVDADTGKSVGEYFLKNEDGSDFTGHVGGIAVDENNLFITQGCYIHRISLATIDALGYTGELCAEEKINLSVGTLSNDNGRGGAYVDCSNGYLWIGNFYQAGSSSYDLPMHEDYPALIRAYKLDPAQPNGLALENKAQNSDIYDYVPEFMYFVNEEKMQGATTSGDYLIMSSSLGTDASKLYVYDRTETVSQEVMIMDEDREVPVITLSPKKSVSLSPYGEEITVAGNYAYVNFESGTVLYRHKSGAYPTDSVWKIDLDKLLDRETEEPVEPTAFASLTLLDCDEAGTTEYVLGAEVELPLPVKTSDTEIYTFVEWTDGTNTYKAGDVITLNEDLTLTAIWETEFLDTATLTLADCDEAGTTAYVVGTEVTLVTPSKTSKTGTYTFAGWTDGTNTYNAGDVITLDESITLTAVWEFANNGIVTLAFDEISLVRAGAYDSTAAAYDSVITTVTANTTGTKNVNVRMPYSSSSYSTRDYVYVSLDLKNEPKAEQVLINVMATRSGTAKNTLYIDQVEGIPAVGDTNSAGTNVVSLTLNGTTSGVSQALDITEVYNNAIGSKLYLKIYGWAYTDKKPKNYVTLNSSVLDITVTPYVEGKTSVSFDQGADTIYAEANETITLPECTTVIPGRKFAGWSDGTNIYEAGASFTVTGTTAFTATFEADPTTYTDAQKALDGKKVLFIGNSFIYYGRTVASVTKDYPNLSSRNDTKGGFIQLCKLNNIDVTVTNWTIGSHKLSDLMENIECTVCGDGTIHAEYLTDLDYDYVFFSPASYAAQETELLDSAKYIQDTFTAVNPDVKIICIGNIGAYGYSSKEYVWEDVEGKYASLEESGIKVVDWGKLVKGIIDGTYTVPGATETYTKNTFIVKDGYHPNLLTGYMTTLFAYCTVTGDKAEGQPFMQYYDPDLAPVIDIPTYVSTYYTNGDADTNFPEILKNENEIRGIQQLIDTYLAE